MKSILPPIGVKFVASSVKKPSCTIGFSGSVPPRLRNFDRICKSNRVFTETKSPVIDFSDPDWKPKYQKDFERRFDIPHLTDIFEHLVPIPSTFCLRSRTPASEDFADGYSSDEKWHGYINNNDKVLLKTKHYSSPTSAGAECIDPICTWVEQWVHRAGPWGKIYFKPEEVKAAIVTYGGLCPGLNDVIRQIVITLEIYGVKGIIGIPFGYRGFYDEGRHEMPERGINMLFVLGGNGTHAGANTIHNECRKRRMRVAVVGVPKTIDNDILLMEKTFGFDTAVEEAQRAINSAYIECFPWYWHCKTDGPKQWIHSHACFPS